MPLWNGGSTSGQWYFKSEERPTVQINLKQKSCENATEYENSKSNINRKFNIGRSLTTIWDGTTKLKTWHLIRDTLTQIHRFFPPGDECRWYLSSYFHRQYIFEVENKFTYLLFFFQTGGTLLDKNPVSKWNSSQTFQASRKNYWCSSEQMILPLQALNGR